MKTLYFDCSMGAAGDMLSAALLELMPDPGSMMARLNALGIPGVEYRRERAEKCGITGTHMSVLVNGQEEDPEMHSHAHDHDHHHHHHGSMQEITHIVCDHLALPEPVKEDILAVYGLIAEAESTVHGVPLTDIHFHEVGTMDALADVTAVSLMMHELHPEEVIASPVHVGSGHVHCAHGILPVPAPATALLLRGIPSYGGEIRGELCTPTGAALLKHFVSRFGAIPPMSILAVGYGMGKKDFPRANCVRAMLGESWQPENRAKQYTVPEENTLCAGEKTDKILELSCNLDDMTGEEIGFAMEELFSAGALDVFTTPIGMKKNRPGILFRVLCRPEDRECMVRLIFRHTTTLGIRETEYTRYVLERREEKKTAGTSESVAAGDHDSPCEVRRKISRGYGVNREKMEYEDLARLAREQGISLREAKEILGK